jgi:hypothetical protein
MHVTCRCVSSSHCAPASVPLWRYRRKRHLQNLRPGNCPASFLFRGMLIRVVGFGTKELCASEISPLERGPFCQTALHSSFSERMLAVISSSQRSEKSRRSACPIPTSSLRRRTSIFSRSISLSRLSARRRHERARSLMHNHRCSIRPKQLNHFHSQIYVHGRHGGLLKRKNPWHWQTLSMPRCGQLATRFFDPAERQRRLAQKR